MDLDQYDGEPEPLCYCMMVSLQPRYILEKRLSKYDIVDNRVLKRILAKKPLLESDHIFVEDLVVYDRETGTDKIIYPAAFWRGFPMLCDRMKAAAADAADMQYDYNVKTYPNRYAFNSETGEHELIVG